MPVLSPTRRHLAGLLGAASALQLVAPSLAWGQAQLATADPAPQPPPPVSGLEPDQDPTKVAAERNPFEQLTVPVSVNGQGPFVFLVDTGANTTCISQKVAQALSLPPGPTLHVHTVVGVKPRASVSVDELRIGTRTRKRVRIPSLPIVGMDVDGVLGVDWLKGQRLVLGFQSKSLEITRSKSDVSSQGQVVVPARRKSGQLTIVDADLNGQPISAMLDSGSQLSVGNAALRQLVLNSELGRREKPTMINVVSLTGESFTADQRYLPFIRLGGLQMGNVPVAFADVHVFKLWNLVEKPALVLGMDILAQFETVAIDFGRSFVRFDLSA